MPRSWPSRGRKNAKPKPPIERTITVATITPIGASTPRNSATRSGRAERGVLRAGTITITNGSISSPGIVASGSHPIPSVVTTAGTHSGVKPSAMVPPKMNSASPKARRSPDRSPASAKPEG